MVQHLRKLIRLFYNYHLEKLIAILLLIYFALPIAKPIIKPMAKAIIKHKQGRPTNTVNKQVKKN